MDGPTSAKPVDALRGATGAAEDGKFSPEFDQILRVDDVEVKRITPLSPNLNAIAERWVQSAKQEMLDHFGAASRPGALGISVVRLYFRDDVDPNGALTQVNSLALSTLPTLPPNTLPPVALPFNPTGTLPLGILSVASPDQKSFRCQKTRSAYPQKLLFKGEGQGWVAST